MLIDNLIIMVYVFDNYYILIRCNLILNKFKKK